LLSVCCGIKSRVLYFAFLTAHRAKPIPLMAFHPYLSTSSTSVTPYQTRAFGCPSVRTDLPKANRATRSIADSQNYGDDYNARDLISPPAFSDLAMAPTAFAEGKSKDYLIQLFQTIGYTFPGEVSQVIFQVASRGHGDLATIKDYRAVLNEYVYACEIGKEQEWLEVNGRAEV